MPIHIVPGSKFFEGEPSTSQVLLSADLDAIPV